MAYPHGSENTEVPRLERLRQFEERLAQWQPSDPQLFRNAISTALVLIPVMQSDIAAAFSVSPSTVSRWVNGKTLPHPVAQKAIIKWLKPRALNARVQEEKLAQHDADLDAYLGGSVRAAE